MADCEVKIKTGNEIQVKTDPTKSIFDNYKTAYYQDYNDFIIGEVFRKYSDSLGWTFNDLKNPNNLQKLTKGVYTYYDNMLTENANPDKYNDSLFLKMSDGTYEDIEKNILPKFEQFMANYYRFNPIIKVSNFTLDSDFFDRDYDNNSTTEDDTDFVSPEEQEDAQGKEFDKSGNEDSMIDLADNEIKMMFRLTPKGIWNEDTKKVDYFIDNNGLPKTTDFGSTFNLLLNKMSGTKDYDVFRNLLTNDDTLRVIPEAFFIGQFLKLDKDDSVKTRNEVMLFMKYYQLFSKPKVQVQSFINQDNRNNILIDEISGNIKAIRQNFTSNFQLGDVEDSVKQFLKKDELEGFYLGSIPASTPETKQEKLDFLSLLGIKFTGNGFLDSNYKRDQFDSIIDDKVNFLYKSLANRLSAGQVIRDPVNDLRKSYKSEGENKKQIKSETSSIDALVNLESKYSRVNPSLSTRNSSGDLQYLISMDNQLTIGTYHLNNAQTLSDLHKTSAFINAKYNPLFKNSYFINFLFDKDGNKIPGREVDLSNLSGYKTQKDKRTVAKLERDLSAKDKMIQDFNMMLLSGKTDVMRTETSNSFFAISLKENGKSKNYFPVNGFLSDFKSNSSYKNTIYNYLTGEIARIKSYDDKLKENPTLPISYSKFSIFNQTLEQGNEGLKKELLSGNLDKDSISFNKFMDAYETEMNEEVQNFKNKMDQLGISYSDLLSKNLKDLAIDNDSLLRSFIANTTIQNIEFSIAYSGDPLFVKDFHKRLKGLSSTGDLASIIDLLFDFRNSSYEQGFHTNYSLAGALKVSQRNNDQNFQTQTLKEYKQKDDFAYTQQSMIEGIQKSILLREGGNAKYTDSFVKNELLKEANDQKPADGEGYVSMDFARELSYRFGFNSDELEDLYKYEGLVFRKMLFDDKDSKTPLTSEQSSELQRLESKIIANPDLYGHGVWKATYFGGVQNSTVDAKAYDKFSLAPLLPSDVKNNPILKKLLKDMIKDQVGYVKYQSGTKMFATTPIDINNLQGANHDLYQTELLKLQIKPKYIQNKSTAIPTQMIKLMFTGLFSNGVAKENVKELYNQYISQLKGIQKVQSEKLFKDLGITEDNIDINTLSSRLIDQAKRQGLNSNIISSLQPENGSLKGVLEESGFVEQINNLVAGIADDYLRRFELSGGDFVLVTNANRDKLGFYQFDEKGTKAAECRITLTTEYAKMLNKIHPDGQPIGSLDRINALLKDEKWVKAHEKELTIILDRVPTQGPNSMDVAIIKEFLSPTMGNTIILSDEIVYKSGTDFDYDKEKVLTPKFTSNGDYISEENMDAIKAKIKELEDEYGTILKYAQTEEDQDDTSLDNLVNSIFNDPFSIDPNLAVKETLEEVQDNIKLYYSLKDADFAKLNNNIIDTYKKTLMLPEMFAELVTPNSTRTVKPIADNIGARLGLSAELPKLNKCFNYLDNLNVKNIYFDAKNMLAPFAIDNTYTEMMQYLGININDSYNRYGNIKQPRTIVNLLLSPEELSKIKVGNKYQTSLMEDIDNYIKQHYDSETINATVDAAKDPWFALMGIVRQNVGVVNFMKSLGYPFPRIIDFINQPVLQKLMELQKNGLSKSKAIDTMGALVGINKSSSIQTSVRKAALESLKNDPSIVIKHEELKSPGEYIVTYTRLEPIKGYTLINVLKGIDSEEGKVESEEFKKKWGIQNFTAYINPDDLRKNLNSEIKPDGINRLLLAHFVMMDQHAQEFANFRYYFNFDTKKIGSLIDIKQKDDLNNTIKMSGMFDQEDVNKMKDDSIMSSFMNTEELSRIFKTLFPILGRNDIQQTLYDLYKKYNMNFKIKNQRDQLNMPKVLNNDLITSIIFNFNVKDGQSFVERNKHLLIREEGKRTLGDRLDSLKKQDFYKDLTKSFPVLDQFIVNKHRINFSGDHNGLKYNTYIDNIQMLKPSSMTTIEQEGVISQLRDLQSYKINSYSKEENEKYTQALHGFMQDLFNVGILQSGVSQSYLGYSEFIPSEVRASIFKNAMDNFKGLDKSEFSNFLNKFTNQFTYNNPKYFPTIKEDGKIMNNSNNYSTRFKNYDIKLNFDTDNGGDIEDEPQETTSDKSTTIGPDGLPNVDVNCK